MTRKLSTWYAREKIVYSSKGWEIHWANGTEITHFRYVELDGGKLYSKGIYPTKITKEMLPDSFVSARIFKCWSWLDAARISDMVYRPNMWVNHLFRDDTLYIKFDGKFEEGFDPLGMNAEYDVSVSGWDILEVLKTAKAYGVTGVDEIYAQMRDKVIAYKEQYPDEADAIEPEEFDAMLQE